jgi:hypothetical protein
LTSLKLEVGSLQDLLNERDRARQVFSSQGRDQPAGSRGKNVNIVPKQASNSKEGKNLLDMASAATTPAVKIIKLRETSLPSDQDRSQSRDENTQPK